MKTNNAGIDLIKSFEGCKLKAYRDVVGVLTIGYGHTGVDVREGQVITQDEADAFLRMDLVDAERLVSQAVTTKINDNQFAALVSFAYNVGIGNLRKSMLLRCINKNNAQGAADEFLKWDRAGGIVVSGLTRRRKAERALFIA